MLVLLRSRPLLIGFASLLIIFFFWGEWSFYVTQTVSFYYYPAYTFFIIVSLVLCGIKVLKDSSNVGKVLATVPVFLIIFFLIFAQEIEYYEMKLKAIFFTNYPSLCQTKALDKNQSYVCYHDFIFFPYGSPNNDNWLVVEEAATVDGSYEQRLQDVGQLIFKKNVTQIPKSIECTFGGIDRMAGRMYWVHSDCDK